MKLPGEAFNISYLVVSMVFDANLPTKLHDTETKHLHLWADFPT